MKKGFTLAEILITLTVVGVVAVLTLPNVIQGFDKRSHVAQLQRAYNALTNAVGQIRASEQAFDLSTSSLATPEGRNNFLYKYFVVQKECSENTTSGCLADSYGSYDLSRNYPTNLSDSSYKGAYKTGNNFKCVTIDSGAAFCLSTFQNGTARIILDVNGIKKPNLNGRDLFKFNIFPDGRLGVIDRTTEKGRSYENNSFVTSCEPSSFADGCLYKIMVDGWEMNY